jgi:CheY-like chemotaxis protein
MSTPQAPADLNGRRILLVEDEFLIADEMAETLSDCGAEVVGPAATVEQAHDLLASHGVRLHAAVLDLNLAGKMVFPVADVLVSQGVPFVFTTGYEAWNVPERYADVPRFEKPVDVALVARALFG